MQTLKKRIMNYMKEKLQINDYFEMEKVSLKLNPKLFRFNLTTYIKELEVY